MITVKGVYLEKNEQWGKQAVRKANLMINIHDNYMQIGTFPAVVTL